MKYRKALQEELDATLSGVLDFGIITVLDNIAKGRDDDMAKRAARALFKVASCYIEDADVNRDPRRI